MVFGIFENVVDRFWHFQNVSAKKFWMVSVCFFISCIFRMFSGIFGWFLLFSKQKCRKMTTPHACFFIGWCTVYIYIYIYNNIIYTHIYLRPSDPMKTHLFCPIRSDPGVIRSDRIGEKISKKVILKKEKKRGDLYVFFKSDRIGKFPDLPIRSDPQDRNV